MWYILVFQPSKCRNTHFQRQIWSIWPIFPNDPESLPKVCYIKRKNSENLSKCRNSESAEGSDKAACPSSPNKDNLDLMVNIVISPKMIHKYLKVRPAPTQACPGLSHSKASSCSSTWAVASCLIRGVHDFDDALVLSRDCSGGLLLLKNKVLTKNLPKKFKPLDPFWIYIFGEFTF